MSQKRSPAKHVTAGEFLNQQIKNRGFESVYGVHASVMRKPEVAVEFPPDLVRFNNPTGTVVWGSPYNFRLQISDCRLKMAFFNLKSEI